MTRAQLNMVRLISQFMLPLIVIAAGIFGLVEAEIVVRRSLTHLL